MPRDGLAAHEALVTKLTLVAADEKGTHEVRCRIDGPERPHSGPAARTRTERRPRTSP